MTLEKRITKWMRSMVKKYPSIHFKYEYSQDRRAYLIAVFPELFTVDSDTYCKDEIDFSLKLYKKYPYETVLFGTEENLFRVSDRALQIGEGTLRSVISEVMFPTNEYLPIPIKPETNVFIPQDLAVSL